MIAIRHGLNRFLQTNTSYNIANEHVFKESKRVGTNDECLCPAIKWQGALGVYFVRPSVILSHQFVFSTPPTSLHGFEWKLTGMLHQKSRSACGEIIYVRQILAELWSLAFRIFTHFSLSSQLLLHPCVDLNEIWQGRCSTNLGVHVGR